MGDYMRKSKRERESSVMEVGRRTVEVTSSTLSKRRKISSEIQLENQCCEVSSPTFSISPAVSETSDHVPAWEYSSNKSSESSMEDNLRSVDLKLSNDFETESSTFNTGRFSNFSRETSPTSELCGESSDEVESTTSKPAPVSLSRKLPAVIMPPLEEIEKFLTAAEEKERKRFADKYNFDIVKGVPLEGKYKWVRLQ